MPTNDFLPFATQAGANVTTQTDYAALAARSTGFSSGVASSAQINKALRQASFISAALAQVVADLSNQNVLDDGILATLVANMKATHAGRLIGVQVFSTPGTATYTPTTGTNSVVVEVQGGGGAGGGAQATAASTVSVCPGGNAGAFAITRLTSGFSGVTVTVGAGGSGSAGASGGNGGTSSFGALASAPGGNGGSTYIPVAPPCVNVNVTGYTNPSASGSVIATGIGGRGAPAVATGVGYGGSGTGGASRYGSGGPEVGLTASATVGAAAPSFGSGGSGATSGQGAAAAAGGAGKSGVVIIWEYA